MINEELTFKKFGYYAKDLAPKSGKRIVVNCSKCGIIREIKKDGYHPLCKSCSLKGKPKPEGFGGNISKFLKGKTWEETMGTPRAQKRKKELSLRGSGLTKENCVWRKKQAEKMEGRHVVKESHGISCSCWICKFQRGEILGKEHPMYGHVWTKESLELKSKVMRQLYAEGKHSNCNKEYDLKRIEKIVKSLCKRPTSYEQRLQEIIKEYSLPYKYVGDGSFWITSEGKHINPDFINMNGKKVIIETFAEIYKKKVFGSVENYKKERSRLFGNFGWKVIYLDGKDILRKDWKEYCYNKIKEEE